MKKLWQYLTKQQKNMSILWKHMMMVCILALALLALIVNNQQSLKTLTSDNIGKFQIALDRDCALLGEAMHRTIAIPAGVEGTRYYDYIKGVTGGFLEDKYYPVLDYLRKALNNQVYLQGDSSMSLLYMSGCGSIVTNDRNFPTAEECFEKHIRFSQTGTEPILGYSTSGSIDLDNMPENMRSWLQQYAEQIEYIQKNNIIVHKRTAANCGSSIAPTLTSKWYQKNIYYDQCPMVTSYTDPDCTQPYEYKDEQNL